MVFQGVRDFYHSKFIPAEPNFYHFNTGSEELATFTGRLILTPKFRLRFARPDPHAMYMAALSRMRVPSPTANSHHHLTPRLPHTCPAAPDLRGGDTSDTLYRGVSLYPIRCIIHPIHSVSIFLRDTM